MLYNTIERYLMKKDDKKITALYCRHSTKSDEFIEKQKKPLLDYVKINNIEKYEFYIDNGYSGISLDRPALKQLLVDIEKGKIAAIAVTHNNRLLRNYPDKQIEYWGNFVKLGHILGKNRIGHITLQKP